MIITLSLKDPDGVANSIQESLLQSLENVREDLSEEEIESIMDVRQERILTALEPWVQFGEYVGIEIDTETNTAKVLGA